MSESTDESFFEGELERLRKLALEQGQRIEDVERERLREQHWLRCAKCGMQMETVMFAGLQLERCFHCGGTYLDQQELEKIARESSPLVHGLVARLGGPEARTQSGSWSLDANSGGGRTLSDGFGQFVDSELLSSPPSHHEEDGAGWAGMAVVALLVVVGAAYLLIFQRPTVERALGGTEARVVDVDKAAVATAPAKPDPAPTPATSAQPSEAPPARATAAATATATSGDAKPADDAEPADDAQPADDVAAEPATDADTKPADQGGAKPADAAKPSPKADANAVEGKAPAPPPGPKSYAAQIKAGKDALMNGQVSKAMRLFEAAVRQRPGSADALAGMGWGYINLKKPHVAVVKFRQALGANSRHGDAYIGLGKAFRMMSKPREAADAYRKYLELHPKGPKATIAKNAIETLSP